MINRKIRLFLMTIIISFHLLLPSFAGFVSVSDFTDEGENTPKRGVWIHFHKDGGNIPQDDLVIRPSKATFNESKIQWNDNNYNNLAQQILGNRNISVVRVWEIKNGTELDFAKNFLTVVLDGANSNNFETSFSSHSPYNKDVSNIHEEKAWENYVKSYNK